MIHNKHIYEFYYFFSVVINIRGFFGYLGYCICNILSLCVLSVTIYVKYMVTDGYLFDFWLPNCRVIQIKNGDPFESPLTAYPNQSTQYSLPCLCGLIELYRIFARTCASKSMPFHPAKSATRMMISANSSSNEPLINCE